MNTEMNLQRISINRLKPAKYNPRKTSRPGDPAYEKIRRSLHDFGYVDPVIWNEVTGNIVGGPPALQGAVSEGATEIDCVVVHIEDRRMRRRSILPSTRPWVNGSRWRWQTCWRPAVLGL